MAAHSILKLTIIYRYTILELLELKYSDWILGSDNNGTH